MHRRHPHAHPFATPFLALVATVTMTAAMASCGSDSPGATAGTSGSIAPADSPDAGPTAADTTPDGAPDASPDTSPDITPDTAPDATTPATPDSVAVDTSVPTSIVDTEFCRTAAEAETLGDEVDAAQQAGPAELEQAVTAALAASQATLALAPADIVDLMTSTVDFQERFVALLQQYEWDADAAFASPEATTLMEDADTVQQELDQVRDYLEVNCGIVNDSAQSSDTSSTIDLADGDAGLREFIQLYAQGANVVVTQEQEDCFVDELSGKVEVSALESLLAGRQDDAAQVAVGVAALACKIITQ